ncbi:hypothetical protein IQ272_18000, partial [Chroococcidiopsidales cyanobacterium LEGE 13417]|nr:hypothetical protein [Chroococcidiopsidales cyanobacterium LEGE 13417]
MQFAIRRGGFSAGITAKTKHPGSKPARTGFGDRGGFSAGITAKTKYPGQNPPVTGLGIGAGLAKESQPR